MAKDFFKYENTTTLPKSSDNYKIHFIGICGVAMAQLAVALSRKGFRVQGSDKEFYEPMGGLLRQNNIKTFQGYSEANLTDDINLVVIGNAVSYGNPEVSVVEQKNLPYTFFSKLLDETIIQDRHSIVVCGTHGKTTTTSMMASIFVEKGKQNGDDPSYFIGGIAQNLPESLHDGKGKFSIVEGDEYDSAFFHKIAKFFSYHPATCIINAIEYDHDDLYPTVEDMIEAFDKLVNGMSDKGTVIACVDFENIRKRLPAWSGATKCKFITFGASEGADWRIIDRKISNANKQTVTLESKEVGQITFTIPLIGEFNARNATAAIIAAYINGVSIKDSTSTLEKFVAVKRRQEVRYDKDGITIIEDFAKHPTAVTGIIKGVREAYPNRRLIAVYEPRTNTSRRKFFHNDYVTIFKTADMTIISHIAAMTSDATRPVLDIPELVDDINKAGGNSKVLPDVAAIKEFLVTELNSGDVAVIMSNGSFGGLVQMLVDHYNG